jgi:hypothetical protein
VNGGRDDLLAGACFAHHQYRHVRARHHAH